MTEDCVNIRCCEVAVCVGAVQIIRGLSFDCCTRDWVVVSGAPQAQTSALLRKLRALCPEPPARVWALDAGPAAAAGAGQTNVGGPAGVRAQALAWLERTGLREEATPGPGRRGSVECGFAVPPMAPPSPPQVLILDNPLASADSRSARILLPAVRDLITDGAIVVIAHCRQGATAGLKPDDIVVERRRVASICI